MAERAPLPGWGEFPDGGAALPCPIGMTVAAGFGDSSYWQLTVTIHRQGHNDNPRIAAEDAARAMVAEMAAALGGRVVWDAEGGTDAPVA